MSVYAFCRNCEHIITRMVTGTGAQPVKEETCPARFNPYEGKWAPEHGVNPYQCPRNEQFLQLQQHRNGRSSHR